MHRIRDIEMRMACEEFRGWIKRRTLDTGLPVLLLSTPGLWNNSAIALVNPALPVANFIAGCYMTLFPTRVWHWPWRLQVLWRVSPSWLADGLPIYQSSWRNIPYDLILQHRWQNLKYRNFDIILFVEYFVSGGNSSVTYRFPFLFMIKFYDLQVCLILWARKLLFHKFWCFADRASQYNLSSWST